MTPRRRVILAAMMSCACLAQAHAQQRTVAIANMVEIPQLLEVRDGLLEGLKAAGYRDGANLKVAYQSAQGNPTTAMQVVRKFIGERPDVLVTLTTPVTQAAVTAGRGVPIVFAVVTDPVGAKVVTRMQQPGGNITGVSDLAPIAEQIRLMKTLVPQLKRLGVLYNAGLDGSRYQLDVLKGIAGQQNLNVVEASVVTSNDAIAGMRSLVGKVDAVWVPNDVVIYAAFEAVARVAQEQKIPLFAAETRTVERGAVAAIGFDYTAVGHEAAKLVAQVLGGKKPGEMDIVVPSAFRTVVNRKAAGATGLAIPQDVLARATVIGG